MRFGGERVKERTGKRGKYTVGVHLTGQKEGGKDTEAEDETPQGKEQDPYCCYNMD